MAKQAPRFRLYDQNQMSLIPHSLEDFIPALHPVRIVNKVIDELDLSKLYEKSSNRGALGYHPKMLLKVMVYAYVSNIYSSRKMEKVCKENVHFMWLSGMNFPDHNTLNRFRIAALKDNIESIFYQIVSLFMQQGFICIEEAFVDGTKIEANANKYTFVWKKAVVNYKEKMFEQIQSIWEYADSVARQEQELPPPPDFKKMDQDSLTETINTLNSILKKSPNASKEVKSKLTRIAREYPKKLEEYLEKEEILQERNSYSKTDQDATFMRMKEDHMQNGQLKPGYNVQISTNNQFILSYSLHSNPTDTTTLIPHLENFKDNLGNLPKALTADAGYGSEENYHYLEEQNVDAYVKYNSFNNEQEEASKKPRANSKADKKPFSVDKLYYNEQNDSYTCPIGQQMEYLDTVTRKTTTGFCQTIKRYQAKNCSGCPLYTLCHKAKGNRIIEVNENLKNHRKKASDLLQSDLGKEKRKKRCHDVETVFGNIKQNHGFRRFMLRGKEKVSLEFGLLAIAQNIRKRVA
ncbi:IS1182 family transposase [Myroides sp. LJL116]